MGNRATLRLATASCFALAAKPVLEHACRQALPGRSLLVYHQTLSKNLLGSYQAFLSYFQDFLPKLKPTGLGSANNGACARISDQQWPCRRMHAAGAQPLEIAASPHEAAPSDPNVQRRHEVEVAGIALAVLVRLTRHAGDCPHVISRFATINALH